MGSGASWRTRRAAAGQLAAPNTMCTYTVTQCCPGATDVPPPPMPYAAAGYGVPATSQLIDWTGPN